MGSFITLDLVVPLIGTPAPFVQLRRFHELASHRVCCYPTTRDWIASNQTGYDTLGFLDFSEDEKKNISTTIRNQYAFDPLNDVTLRDGGSSRRGERPIDDDKGALAMAEVLLTMREKGRKYP
jgi:hypothetical protein